MDRLGSDPLKPQASLDGFTFIRSYSCLVAWSSLTSPRPLIKSVFEALLTRAVNGMMLGIRRNNFRSCTGPSQQVSVSRYSTFNHSVNKPRSHASDLEYLYSSGWALLTSCSDARAAPMGSNHARHLSSTIFRFLCSLPSSLR